MALMTGGPIGKVNPGIARLNQHWTSAQFRSPTPEANICVADTEEHNDRTIGDVYRTAGHDAVILAVRPLPDDRVRLREILSPKKWKLDEASGCGAALALLRGQSVPELLCERYLADEGWEDLVSATANWRRHRK